MNSKHFTKIALIGLLGMGYVAAGIAEAAPGYVDRDHLFGKVRRSDALYSKGLSQIQVDSYNAVIHYWESRPEVDDLRWLAYVLATAWHESKMRPVREGACNTDECSRRAVRKLHLKGRIKRNYAVPDPITGKSYYGRGFVQVTWPSNYKKLGEAIGLGDRLFLDPDLALDPEIATKILWVGMVEGLFRKGNRLSRFFNSRASDWVNAREIVNGDKNRLQAGRKIGKRIAGYGLFYAGTALQFADAPGKGIAPGDLDTEIVGPDALSPQVAPIPRPEPPTATGTRIDVASVRPEPRMDATAFGEGGVDTIPAEKGSLLSRTVSSMRRELDRLGALVGFGSRSR